MDLSDPTSINNNELTEKEKNHFEASEELEALKSASQHSTDFNLAYLNPDTRLNV